MDIIWTDIVMRDAATRAGEHSESLLGPSRWKTQAKEAAERRMSMATLGGGVLVISLVIFKLIYG